MDTRNRSLFGGTLVAAGLVSGGMAGNASADWSFTNYALNTGLAFAYVADYSSVVSDNAYSYGPTGLDPVSVSDVNLELSAWATNSAVAVSNSSDASWADAYAGINIQVTPNSSFDLLVEWDVDGLDGDYIRVVDLTNAAFLMFEDFSVTPGGADSQLLSLVEGNSYIIQGRSRVGFAGGAVGSESITFTAVPAPGAASLLGLAGFAAARRRRTLGSYLKNLGDS